jgi:hypothetical protein
MTVRDFANWALDASQLRDIARFQNLYYEGPTNNYLGLIGKSSAEIAIIGDVYKHSFTALSETYNVGLSSGYSFGLQGAYARTQTIGVVNEIYAWWQGRDSAAEHYKDLNNNVVGGYVGLWLTQRLSGLTNDQALRAINYIYENSDIFIK